MKTLILRPATVYALFSVVHLLVLALAFAALAWLFLPVLILPGVCCAGLGVFRFLLVRCTCYELTEEELCVRKGILLRRTDQLEWFRVRDLVETQPLILRPFSLIHLELITNDRTNPLLRLSAVPAGHLADLIRERVQHARRNIPVFEIE